MVRDVQHRRECRSDFARSHQPIGRVIGDRSSAQASTRIPHTPVAVVELIPTADIWGVIAGERWEPGWASAPSGRLAREAEDDEGCRPMDGYGPLLEAVMTFEPAVHVFGGFAEDALLHGTSVRSHDDVDVLVGRKELETQLRNARAFGFSSHEVRFEPIEGMPMVIGTTDGTLDLEISVYDLTTEGIVSFRIPDRDGRLFRIELSEGVFEHPPSDLDGIALRTVSPLALYQIRAGITMAGSFGPPRPKDVTAQDALRARFFPDASPESLQPTMEEVPPE
jgi:hypothetical protein